MEPGTKFRIKSMQGEFKFLHYARNSVLETDWVGCSEERTKQFRFFRPERIKGIVKPKKTRKRRIKVDK